MKKIIKRIVLVIILLAIIAAVIFCVVIRKNTYRFIKVKDYEGKVKVTRNEESNKVTKGQLLLNGDEVEVPGDGLLELLVDKDKHILASPDTEFTVKATGFEFLGKVSIEVTSGDALFTIDKKLASKSEFEVTTPNATFSVRGTTFNVNYNKDEEKSELQVIEGTVAVYDGEEEYLAEAGARVVVDEDGIRDLNDLSKANIGDHIFFGSYEQDGSKKNGEEAIEWIVLDKDDDSALLIAANGLDAVPYGYEDGSTTGWEDSNIREWLNDDFYSEAFTENEADKIILHETDNAETEWDYDNVSNEKDITEDYVFLLSRDELEEYFEINEIYDDWGMYTGYSQEAMCHPVQRLIDDELVEICNTDRMLYSDYGYTEDCLGLINGIWWLRTTHKQLLGGNIVAWGVDGWGVYSDTGFNGLRADIMVRPVIQVEYK